jgi:hypothetical protein
MKCRAAREAIVLGLYDEATAQERRDLQEHLAVCRGCAREASTLHDAARAVARAEGLPEPAPLPVPGGRIPALRLSRPILYAAAAVVLVAIVGVAIREVARSGGPAPTASQESHMASGPSGSAVVGGSIGQTGSIAPTSSTGFPGQTGASEPIRQASATRTPVPSSMIARATAAGVSGVSRQARSGASPFPTDASLEAEISSLDSALKTLESDTKEL